LRRLRADLVVVVIDLGILFAVRIPGIPDQLASSSENGWVGLEARTRELHIKSDIHSQ
jgi:hypothetical protein